MNYRRPATSQPRAASRCIRTGAAMSRSRNLVSSLVDREHAFFATFYREFTDNQKRKRQNEIEHLKRQIMTKFRAELKVHIEESTRKEFSRAH